MYEPIRSWRDVSVGAPIVVAVSKFIKPSVIIILITLKLWQNVRHHEATVCYKMIIQTFHFQRGQYIAIPGQALRTELRSCVTCLP